MIGPPCEGRCAPDRCAECRAFHGAGEAALAAGDGVTFPGGVQLVFPAALRRELVRLGRADLAAEVEEPPPARAKGLSKEEWEECARLFPEIGRS